MKHHRLYEIDLENRIALCSVCRYTEIEVKITRTGRTKINCLTRANEIRQYQQERQKQHLKDAPKEKNKFWHSLTDLNTNTMMANCVICGPTDIIRVIQRNKTYYRCGTNSRDGHRLREHPHSYGRVLKGHPLTDIDLENGTAICGKCGPVKLYKEPRREFQAVPGKPIFTLKALEAEKLRIEENTKIVIKYKRQHCCEGCGAIGIEPNNFKFFEPDLPYARRISTLIKVSTSDILLTELEKRKMYCQTCFRVAYKQYLHKNSKSSLTTI